MSWQNQFQTESAAAFPEPFFAALAEAIATVEWAAGTRTIRGPLPGGAVGINEIGYKAVPGKPSTTVATHEAEGGALHATTAAFRLFPTRVDQAASLAFLMRSSAFYEAARLLFVLAFYSAYAPGRSDGLMDLVSVFNRIASSGRYNGVRPLSMATRGGDADTLAINHEAARAAVQAFGEITGAR